MSINGVNLLAGIEKLALKPYDDQTSKEITSWVKGATIGYGHLISKDDWDSYKNGLSKEDALTSITLAPAKILGIEATTGSLEDGKDATLFVSTGDALDMTTNNVEMAFIQGRQIEVFNFQQELYERYMRKYKLPLPNDN